MRAVYLLYGFFDENKDVEDTIVEVYANQEVLSVGVARLKKALASVRCKQAVFDWVYNNEQQTWHSEILKATVMWTRVALTAKAAEMV